MQRLQQAITDFEARPPPKLLAGVESLAGPDVELRDISSEELCMLAACMSRDADWLHRCLWGRDLSMADLLIALGAETGNEPRASVSCLRHFRAQTHVEAGSYRCVRCRQLQQLDAPAPLSTCRGCGDSVFYCVSRLRDI
ncbi:hypothetical protein D0544_00165 [Aestuariirhabdus litorea]|uniref:Uncharacterized protein n=1 Tax=Aestuariirhabdus litorea TaxID=2528527 RepID=A0A3P3VPJ3_9GAMM|nr:hypothetical protein D0544_00165 [Aestuariirhabdus litorea]